MFDDNPRRQVILRHQEVLTMHNVRDTDARRAFDPIVHVHAAGDAAVIQWTRNGPRYVLTPHTPHQVDELAAHAVLGAGEWTQVTGRQAVVHAVRVEDLAGLLDEVVQRSVTAAVDALAPKVATADERADVVDVLVDELAAKVPPAEVMLRPITPADVRRWPEFFISGAGRVLASKTDCGHGYWLTDSCPVCAAEHDEDS